MDIRSTNQFNKQIYRMYTLAIFNAVIAVLALVFNYYKFDINFALFSTLLFINAIAMFFYEPYKIVSYLSKESCDA